MFVDRLLTRGEPVATATIAYVELYSGLTRRYRQGVISPIQYSRMCRQLEEEWSAYMRLELHEDILQLARQLVQQHGLRALDGIHLASALSLRSELGESVTFIASDTQLLRAAACEDLTTMNAETASPM